MTSWLPPDLVWLLYAWRSQSSGVSKVVMNLSLRYDTLISASSLFSSSVSQSKIMSVSLMIEMFKRSRSVVPGSL